MNYFSRAFPRLLRRWGRALARQSSALLACGLLATIPNALLSCKAKDKGENMAVQAAGAAKTSVFECPPGRIETTSTASSTPSKIDLDLTKMSATMIYSTIFDMLVMAEDYIDKNIKVSGWFETYTDPETGEMYYAVVVPDATACCQQGLEFVWPGEHKYPEDFPAIKQEITVTGIYKMIENDGISYNYLEVINLEF